MKKIDWYTVQGIVALILLFALFAFMFIVSEKWEEKNVYESTFTSDTYMYDVYRFDCSNGKEYLAYLHYNWYTYPDNNMIIFDDTWLGGIKCNKITTNIKTNGR